MAKIQKRGEKGAAKNYITRNQALKKLQISLSDFRRLCILKGIYPREPLHKKRANKGSSAPASFYYAKDVQYLLHEPLLVRFREHKAFAKKLARALGRGEWALAKNLEDAKPVARLDHLVKERYPTFTLALQDLQDPLNLVHLFSTLPTNPIPGKTLVPPEVISECGKLISEWKLWAIKTQSLKYVFLGVKGIYYEVDAPGQGGDPVRVRWLEGYEFQQHVPHDVDFRILLTFLDLYRTLISFVLYKLYTEENLVYPPPLDTELDAKGESVGALRLVEKKEDAPAEASSKVSKKEVKRAIKGIKSTEGTADDVDMDETAQEGKDDEEEQFVERPSKEDNEDVAQAPLTTFSSILASAEPSSSKTLLFSPFTFYLSREISARTWEFVIRATGGKVITALQAPTLDSPLAEGVTHVVIDRPMTVEQMRETERGRKVTWVQPQWVADCINRSKILSAEDYAPGKLLPPHLSPWDGEGELARPWLEEHGDAVAVDSVGAEDEDEDEDEDEEEEVADESEAEDEGKTPRYPPALLAAATNPSDSTLRHAAELEAERNGTSHAAFETQLKEATKVHSKSGKATKAVSAGKGEEDLRKIMMSNKKAKLYEKMQYSNRQQAEEVSRNQTRSLSDVMADTSI
ncbi:putative ribosomal large subunit biogenesis-related protein [Kockovaella imperatae]|uniref:Pescadillo homolog n=1 Tax=Kockovaella imperatae TaxID=4999 RepID=A0A1Y1URD5_9TREE|nr:putative ribosomal large subunit biogenesis-related protein [Kockovaella imperatae]ORX40016.1 putative ribosomal large subunit biogenesis-related protein [Kockovaella imperatae]